MKCTFCAAFHRDVAQIALRIAMAIRAAMAVGGGGVRGRQNRRVTARTRPDRGDSAPSIVGARPAPFAHSGATRHALDAVDCDQESHPQDTEQCSCEHL
jgi:hypothetical protein